MDEREYWFELGVWLYQVTAEHTSLVEMRPRPPEAAKMKLMKDLGSIGLWQDPCVMKHLDDGWESMWDKSVCLDPTVWEANGGKCPRCNSTHTLPTFNVT